VSKTPRKIFGRLHGDPFAFRRFRIGQPVRVYTNGVWAKGHITRTRARSVENGPPSTRTAGSTATTTYAVYDTRNLLKRRLLSAIELQQQQAAVAGEVAQ
jgi:hypothetical protein